MTQWLPVVGWEGLYEVSDDGRVRSVDRVVVSLKNGRSRRLRGRELTRTFHVDGYLKVSLSRDGAPITALVHHLVAFAFLGSRPEGLEVAHKDGSRINCAVSNLEYKTHEENMADIPTHRAERLRSVLVG